MRTLWEAAAAMAGRALLSAIFLHEAWVKLSAYDAARAYSEAFGVPGSLLPAAIAIEFGCGLAILVGYQTRVAAILLAAFCLATAILFHAKFDNSGQLLHFEKNLAIAGGFVFLILHGAGAWSLDALLSRRDRASAAA